MSYETGDQIFTLLPIFTRQGTVIPEGSVGEVMRTWGQGLYLVRFEELDEEAVVEESCMELDDDYSA